MFSFPGENWSNVFQKFLHVKYLASASAVFSLCWNGRGFSSLFLVLFLYTSVYWVNGLANVFNTLDVLAVNWCFLQEPLLLTAAGGCESVSSRQAYLVEFLTCIDSSLGHGKHTHDACCRWCPVASARHRGAVQFVWKTWDFASSGLTPNPSRKVWTGTNQYTQNSLKM